jgi:hypothetical protein
MGVDELIGQGTLENEQIAAVVADPGQTHEFECLLLDVQEDFCGSVKLEVTYSFHPEKGPKSTAAWNRWKEKGVLPPGGMRGDEERGSFDNMVEVVQPLALVARTIARDDPKTAAGRGLKHAADHFKGSIDRNSPTNDTLEDGNEAEFYALRSWETWKEGGPILGHFDVKVCSAEGLSNPSHEIVSVSDDMSTMRKAALISFLYFATGAVVFNLNCVTEVGGTEAWTFVDTVYFGIVTITTTGYGDLLPNHNYCNNGTMVFTCFYVFIGVGIIAAALGFMVGRLLEIKAAGEKAIGGQVVIPTVPDDCLERVQWLTSNWTSVLNPVYHATKYLPRSIQPTVKAFSYWGLLKLVVVFYFMNNDPLADEPLGVECTNITFAGNCFLLGDDEIISTTGGVCDMANVGSNCTNFCVSSDFLCIDNVQHHYLPVLDAAYMVSVSLTSVGYGDFSATKQSARTFTIFWLLIGTLLTAKAWGALADMFLQHQQNKLNKKNLNVNFNAKSMMKLDDDASGEVNELEFIAHMLVKTQMVDSMTLNDIRMKFREMDASGDGFITAEDLVMEEARKQTQLEKENEASSTLVEAVTEIPGRGVPGLGITSLG